MLSDRDMHVVWTIKAGANVSWKDFCEIARAIEREATAPLIEQIKQLSDQADRAVSVAECANKQIKEDEALMRDVLEALTAEPEMREGACSVAIEALRERLEAKG